MKYAPTSQPTDEQIERAHPGVVASSGRANGVATATPRASAPASPTMPTSIPARPAPTSQAAGWSLSPRARKALVAAHVAVSVGLLGISASLLFLGSVTALTSDPETARVASRAIRLFSRGFVQPVALATLLTGIILSVGTKWGLFRYYWIVVKLVLTIATVLCGIFVLGPAVDQAIAATAGALPSVAAVRAGIPTTLIVAAAANVLMLVSATVISVYKPWGTIGRRGGERVRANGR
jgi:hypothetical protein